MEFRESETVELKQVYVGDLRKEIIAMANSEGGTIYIGVNDDGNVVGLENADETIQRIANTARDSIRPDVTMFVHYEALTIQGKTVVAVRVQCGTCRPYYLAAKGLRPEGVYVRQGTSSVPATDAAIRRMIKDTDGDNYEDMRSLSQVLTFHQAADMFAQRKLAFDRTQMKTLGLIGADNLFTNLGLLLSDQCPHILKAATFAGADQMEFQDRREFSGSLLKQLDDAYAYIDLRNQTSATFEGLRRIDHRAFPDAALREALLNAIVHRDYSYSASTLISVYSDRIEFVSIGGLIHGVTLADVLLGLSVCRNQKLANVFYRLELIEAYGTGMRKIQTAYAGSEATPEIFASDNAFKVVLPSQTAASRIKKGSPLPALGDRESAVLALVEEKGAIVRGDVETLLGLKTATAIRLLKQMTQAGSLTSVGKGKNTRYIRL